MTSTAAARAQPAGDLGFAWLTLPSGQRLTFVDVPGQERSVPNLLAGAGPAAAVLFAVAADAGWSSQSARQLAMLDALGIRRGLLVVTRADLADPGPALSQASGQIAASGLGDVEALAVSAVTGQGLPELVGALGRLADSLPVPDPCAPVRVWVDRSFSAAGGATAITGTLAAGTVRTGDELVIAPSMRPVRVRAIRCMGEPTAELTGPARATFQLDGASAEQLGRGSAMVQPGRWVLADVIDVRLSGSGRTGPASSVPASPCRRSVSALRCATPVSATPAPGTAVTATPVRSPPSQPPRSQPPWCPAVWPPARQRIAPAAGHVRARRDRAHGRPGPPADQQGRQARAARADSAARRRPGPAARRGRAGRLDAGGQDAGPGAGRQVVGDSAPSCST